MVRVTRGFKARKRRKKVLRQASGYSGARRRLFKTAKEAVQKAYCYSYRDRKVKKRNFRKLWIMRINAASRLYNLNYSVFINKLKINKIYINRRVLAELAVMDSIGFKEIVKVIS